MKKTTTARTNTKEKIPAPTLNINKYGYIIKHPGRYRLMYSIAALTWVVACFGLYRFLVLNIWHIVIFTPIVLIVCYYRLISYILLANYPGFSKSKHENLVSTYWQKHEANPPTVDIFLPICGEDPEILKQTWDNITHIDYPQYTVYVLDDANDERAKNLAQEYGFNYVVRPDRPKYKKAGNLRNGYEISKGEFVLILDADFIPHPDILKDTVPYFDDPEIGIVQTPQYFFNTYDDPKNAIQFGAAAVVEEKYKVLQVTRDRFKAAACVGTSAVYRRKAIIEGGGPPRVERSEDAWERLLIMKVGYNLRYIPLILAAGLTPDSPEKYFKQHNRWSTGSVEINLSKIFWSAPMNPVQRIIFLQNFFYYLSEALSLILSMQLFVLLIFYAGSINWRYSLLFLPHIIMYYFVLPSTRQLGNWWKTSITATTQIYTYFLTYLTFLRGNLMEWIPTNKSFARINSYYLTSVWLNALYITISVFLLSIGLVLHIEKIPNNPSILVVLFWISLSIFQHSMNLVYNLNYIYGAKSKQVETNVITKSNFLQWRLQLAGGAAVILVLLVGTVSAIALTVDNPINSQSGIAGASEKVADAQPQNNGNSSTDGVQADSTIVEASVVSENEQNSNTEQVTPPSTNVTGNSSQINISNITLNQENYTATVTEGDTLSSIVRRFINKYDAETSGETLSKAQKAYIEANIVQQLGDREVQIGENIVISKAIVAQYASTSVTLDPQQTQVWDNYAQYI